MRGGGYRRCGRCRHELSRLHLPLCEKFLANTDIAHEPQHIVPGPVSRGWITTARRAVTSAAQLRMFNQLDSHDTARFKTLLGKARRATAAGGGLAVYWPGVPCIYYGDEVGVDGGYK